MLNLELKCVGTIQFEENNIFKGVWYAFFLNIM